MNRKTWAIALAYVVAGALGYTCSKVSQAPQPAPADSADCVSPPDSLHQLPQFARCHANPPQLTVPFDSARRLPLTPIRGGVTLAPTDTSKVQVSADAAGQVGATLGPALAPALVPTVSTAVRFQMYKASGAWRWRLIVIATGRRLAVSGESYLTARDDSVSIGVVKKTAAFAPIGR